MIYEVVPATEDHAIEMLEVGLRERDVVEVYRFSGVNQNQALLESYYGTHRPYAALYDGEPVSIFGVTPRGVITRDGTPWMLATDKAEDYKLAFAKISRTAFACMCREYQYLENYVDDENVTSILWLEWLGFTVVSEPEYIGDYLFRRFYWRR